MKGYILKILKRINSAWFDPSIDLYFPDGKSFFAFSVPYLVVGTTNILYVYENFGADWRLISSSHVDGMKENCIDMRYCTCAAN